MAAGPAKDKAKKLRPAMWRIAMVCFLRLGCTARQFGLFANSRFGAILKQGRAPSREFLHEQNCHAVNVINTDLDGGSNLFNPFQKHA